MEQLKNQIIKYLEEEKIKVISFENSNSRDILFEQPAELIISINPDDLPKWNYFSLRMNDNEDKYKPISTSYYDGIYKFTFNYIDNNIEREMLHQLLSHFLNILKKKYYIVCPDVNDFSVLIKPTHRCNLDCKYCYDKPFREKIKDDMPMEVLDNFLDLVSKYTRNINLIWHGGEPTMVGTEWYEHAYEVLAKYPMLNYKSNIMTNGVALSDKWFELFNKYNISVGMSYNSFHQTKLRCSRQDNYSIEKEIKLSEKLENTLKKHKIGVIEVINKENYKDQIKIYEYYKSIDCKVCMNHVFYTEQTAKNKLGLSPQDYAKEFKKYFRHWLFDKEGISERTAESMLEFVMGEPRGTCEYTDCRKKWLGLNPLGEVYPCDRYYPDKYRIGLADGFTSINDIFNSQAYLLYSTEIQNRFDNKCRGCGYWFACHGGCNASVIERTGNAEGVDEFSCELFQLQFNSAYEIMREIDLVWDDNLNPIAKNILIKGGFYSVKEISRYFNDTKMNLPSLEYDPKDLLNCSEYQVFRGINYIKDSAWKYSRHIDFINSDTNDDRKTNDNARRNDLYNYLKTVAKKQFSKNS